MTSFALEIPARQLVITARSYECLAPSSRSAPPMWQRLLWAFLIALLWQSAEYALNSYQLLHREARRLKADARWCAKKFAKNFVEKPCQFLFIHLLQRSIGSVVYA